MDEKREYYITDRFDIEMLPDESCAVHFWKTDLSEIAYMQLKSAIHNENIARKVTEILNGAEASIPKRMNMRTMVFVTPKANRHLESVSEIPKLKRGDKIVVIRFKTERSNAEKAEQVADCDIEFYVAEVALRNSVAY